MFWNLVNPGYGPIALNEGVGVWWDADALIDSDFAHSRFRFNGQNYADETAWLAAIGGSKSGITRTIGPYVAGAEVLPDGGFASGVDSWADAPATAANGDVSQVANRLRLSYTGAGTAYNARRPTTVLANRAYRFQATVPARAGGGISAASVRAAADTDLGNGAVANVNFGNALPQTLSVVQAAPSTTLYFGLGSAGTASAANWIEVDDASVLEVYPYAAFTPGSLSARLNFTTPAAASGNKVLAEWSDDNTSRRSSVRVVFDASAHLRLIVTQDAFDWANLDLGVVGTSEAHTIALAVTANRVSASLDGGTLVTDTSSTTPGIGVLRICRSASGETWDGTIERVRIYAEALSDAALVSPFKALVIWGDSLSATTGASDAAHTWWGLLAADLGWTVISKGVGGDDTATELARFNAETSYRNWLNIFCDRPYNGEMSLPVTPLDNLAAMVAQVARFFVVPPVLNSTSGLPDIAATDIDAIKAALLTGIYAGHSLDSAAQAAFQTTLDSDSTRVGTAGDYIHWNDTGHAAVKAAVKAGLQAVGLVP